MKFFKNIFKNSYFRKLYLKDKFLFGFVLLFTVAAILVNFTRLETSPFFLWKLYSERYYPKEEYNIYEIRFNDGDLLDLKHTWNSPQHEFLTGPLDYYLSVKAKNGMDPWQNYLENYWAVKHQAFKSIVHGLYNHASQFEAFPQWYRKYLSQIEKKDIKNIYVLNKKIRFENDGTVNEISSDTLLVIK
ncbi:MAG TPA: hypothetical protein VMI12_00765 [Puia sp.]|nr:hypothetical protein [Puia sp.]